MTSQYHDTSILSRRRLLYLLGAGTAAAATAACTNTSTGTGSGVSATPSELVLPSAATKLPTGTVKLTWMDSGDAKAAFAQALAAAYHKKHPNITINYDTSAWTAIDQVLSAGFRNGSAPDIFQLPATIPLQTAINNGWVGAFDDVVPHFDTVKKRFPPGALVDGINIFNGKTYMMPMTGLARLGNLLLFNQDYTKQAGLDLNNEVISWDQLRSYLKKLTKQGNGEYYGLIYGTDISGAVSDMANMAGVRSGLVNTTLGGIDWKTGEFSSFTNPLAEHIVELILAIASDGSIHPDSVSLDVTSARARFPLGQAAIMFQGPWNIPIWKQTNPGFHLGLNLPAQHDPSDIYPVSSPPGGSNSWLYNSRTKYGPVIGDIFHFWASPDGQTQWAEYDPAGDPPFDTAAAKHATMDALSRKALSLGERYTAIRPEPSVRNPDVEQVDLAFVPPTQGFPQLLQGLLSKQIDKSVKQVLAQAKSDAEKALDAAITKARSKGAKVSREDFVFSDWNPRTPYLKLYEK